MANGKPVPTWFVEEQMRLFEHLSAPLRLLMSEAEEPDVAMMSHALLQRCMASSSSASRRG
jgi:hypothetical protein